jgi:phage virion morphogenesis protein
MTGAGVTLTGYDETLAELDGIAARAANPRAMWDQIGASLVASTQRRFEDGSAPDGSPWPPSIRALATGGKTLIDSARLFQSITHEASDTGVAVGTNVLYAAIHQLGGTIAAKDAPYLKFKIGDRWASKKSVTIPARPFLGLDDDDEREIVRIGEDWIAGEAAERGAAP